MTNSLLDNLTYKSNKPTFLTKITPEMLKKLNHRQLETISGIQTANQLFQEAKLDNISDFMTNLVMAESNIGGDKEGSYSSGPSQIDRIRYKDLQDKAASGEKETINRASLANKLLELDSRYKEGIDILNLTDDERKDPMINSLLTRMALATIEEKIPSNLSEQAVYWKKEWNSRLGKGTPEHFINQVQIYNLKLNNKTHDGTPLKDIKSDEKGNYYIKYEE
jgi:hypothetical protein